MGCIVDVGAAFDWTEKEVRWLDASERAPDYLMDKAQSRARFLNDANFDPSISFNAFCPLAVGPRHGQHVVQCSPGQAK
jgi:hypothetical protein